MDTVYILLATYNGDRYLQQQLDSFISQTYSNWILVVSDDCSSDNTTNILNDFKNKYENRVYIINNEKPSGSAKSNFINLLSHSNLIENGYIMFSDQDDIWLPNKIELTLKRMKELENDDPNIPCLVYSDLYVVNEQLDIVDHSFFNYSNLSSKCNSLNHILIQNNMAGCTSMINKSLYKIFINHEIPKNFIMHDWWLLILAKSIGKVSIINEPLIYYRQHTTNSVGAPQYGFQLFLNKIKKKDTKILIKETMKQAEEFCKIYGKILPKENFNIIKKYSEIYKSNKIIRIYSYFKYNYLKYGFFRKMGQIIYG